jgi:FAD/FMN-containing dehydrogenase
MSLEGELQALGLDVDASEPTRRAYSHDASIFSLRPEAVVFPRTAAEVVAVVRFAAGHTGVSLVARSAGTDMTGGAIGTSLIVDFTRHMHGLADIVADASVPGQSGYADVEPGMFYRDFEHATLARGLQFPTYPASRELCAVGGMVANNAGGERSLAFGQTVDWVRQVHVVLADGSECDIGPLDREGLERKLTRQDFEGDIYRGMHRLVTSHADIVAGMRPKVSKNSSGYYLWRVWDRERDIFDLSKLVVGSQGTLAVITQARLGLMRPQPERAMCVVFLDDMEHVADVVNALLEFKPEALESFDDKTLWFTLRFLPDFVRIIGASNLVALGLQFLPEAWMALRGGLPKLILMAEFASDDAAEAHGRAKRALDRVRQMGLKARLTKNTEESHKYWTIRRQSFQVIRSHAKGKRTTPFIDDIIVRPDDMPTFLPELYRILEPYKLVLTIAGHPGNGNFHIIPLMDLSDERSRRIIPELSDKVYDLVLRYGGSISAEHNDGLIHAPWVERQFGHEAYELFRQTKRIWDPKGILNPGKKIDVDREWALRHLRTD